MTNEELFTDLKQFITTAISQQMAGMATKDDIADLRTELKTLDEKLDLIQDAVAESLTHTTQVTNATLQDHERRLRRLEHRPA